MKLNLATFCAVILVLIGIGASKPIRAEDKDTGCIVVTGSDSNGKDLTDSDVYLEEEDGRGGWKKPDGASKKHVGKSDKGEAKFCGLKPGKKYRVIGRKDSDDNEGNWHVFIFQPEQMTKLMGVVISIKMKAKRVPNQQPIPIVNPSKIGGGLSSLTHP